MKVIVGIERQIKPKITDINMQAHFGRKKKPFILKIATLYLLIKILYHAV